MNARQFLDILHVAERLKDTPRHCTTSQGRIESVAEHSWRISLMAFLLRHEFPDLNMDKVVDMCLIHDLGECFTGDIPTFMKTDTDRKTEDTLLNQWVASLPADVSENLRVLYSEMEEQQSPEARLYKALDKLEALIQHNESPLYTWAENEYELNKTYATDTVAFSDWLTALRKEILADTLEKIRTESASTSESVSAPANSRTAEEEEAVRRIAYYEQLLDEVQQVIDRPGVSPAELLEVLDQVRSLETYYDSPVWKEDFAADEAGLFPQDLKRGVLSEDGIYNVLERYRELIGTE